jgi:AcrR family transcriptional regulator
MTNLTPIPKRIRRTPDEARRVILDAAEAGMAASGPAGIRLQDVAAAAGVSHPAILHHFGSREGLILALNRRTLEDLKVVLMSAMQAAEGSGPNAVAAAFAAYRNGLAQRMVWLLQAQTEFGAAGLPVFDEMVEALHALRVSIAAPGALVDKADTRAIVHLTTIAAFGDAILGPRLRRASGLAEELAERRDFEIWFSALVNGFVAMKAAKLK